jgi:hypothetical protein
MGARARIARIVRGGHGEREELWELIHALPGRLDPELLLFSTDLKP